MTTYTSNGFSLYMTPDYDERLLGVEPSASIKVTLPDGVETFSYSSYPQPNDDNPKTVMHQEFTITEVNGRPVSEYGGQVEIGVVQLYWDGADGGSYSTTALLLDLWGGYVPDYGYVSGVSIFHVAGDPFPPVTTWQEGNAIYHSVTNMGPGIGRFAPDTPISLEDFFQEGGGGLHQVGTSGMDVLEGGAHDDILEGRGSADDLSGGRGDDQLFGGRGHDVLKGGGGHDVLKGGAGRDVLKGGGGRDTLRGQDSNDVLKGNGGKDRLFGGKGQDTLDGGVGNDLLNGGRGADTFVFSKGKDRLAGFGDNDFIDLRKADGIDSFEDLQASHISIENGHLVIEDDAGNTLTILNRGLSDISAEDFIF
ncbi:MAG: calcium-binding protein [Pseudomonadota bacterium]|nr:calcium-binding protein [Pseudomonadota bacterium]